MLKWLFSKVVKLREKVGSDFGQEDVEKPFLEHLEDLRTMLVRIAGTLAGFVVCTFLFYPYLWSLITFPLTLAGIQDKIIFQQLSPIGGFMAIMNLSIVGGIVISCPLLLYFIMQFVLPGLRTTEKKVMFPALAVGGGLFLIGACFAYFVVVPKALVFFYGFNTGLSAKSAVAPMLLQVDLSQFVRFDPFHVINPVITLKAIPVTPAAPVIFWGISEYVKFVCQFILIFGLCFELPVVVMALVKLDILSYKIMKTTRAWAAIGICVVSAVVAPSPDVFTLGLIAVPLYLLYEICIWLAWWLDKRDRELYPEHYKSVEEDEKAIEAGDDWDNDSYNPWNSDEDDEDELRPSARPSPPGTQPMTDTHPDTPAETHAGEGGDVTPHPDAEPQAGDSGGQPPASDSAPGTPPKPTPKQPDDTGSQP
jgi:sec-independent protein translocase protein TatC